VWGPSGLLAQLGHRHPRRHLGRRAALAHEHAVSAHPVQPQRPPAALDHDRRHSPAPGAPITTVITRRAWGVRVRHGRPRRRASGRTGRAGHKCAPALPAAAHPPGEGPAAGRGQGPCRPTPPTTQAGGAAGAPPSPSEPSRRSDRTPRTAGLPATGTGRAVGEPSTAAFGQLTRQTPTDQREDR
jgi:hypothetical protein